MLKPELIVTWPWTTPAQVGWLRERGIAIFEADARTIDGIADDVDRIGALTGTAALASAASAALRERIARLTLRAVDSPLRVFYQLSDVPLFTLGGHHLSARRLPRAAGRMSSER